MPQKNTFLAGIILLIAACGGDQRPEPVTAADRVLLNGAVYTVDAERGWAEAVAIKDGEVIYVGDNEGAGAYITTESEIIDLVGQMALPGFHDSHVHVLTGIMDEDECDLLRIPTAEEVAVKLKECNGLAGIGDDEWIIGGGWISPR